jgi:predicted flap endonuclease-1-like 5' DNA nuclease
LLNYDGVFLAGNAADNTVVAEYVNQGGCVYLAAGTGWEGAAAEAERWNKFLGTVGMKLEPIYEGFEGRFECRYEHPVFLGVQSLYYCGGNPVFTTSAAQSGSQIIARSPQGKGTIGIFDASLSAAHIEREKAEREKAEREKAEREKAERENKLAELNQIISEQKKKIADQDEKLKKCADCEQKLAEQEQKIAEQEKKIAELKAKPTIPAKPDNLTIIEGIGPKISELLAKEGITSFQQLASTSGDRLKAILATDKNMRLADPTTWPEQARLAAEGRKDELAALQSKLRGGRG